MDLPDIIVRLEEYHDRLKLRTKDIDMINRRYVQWLREKYSTQEPFYDHRDQVLNIFKKLDKFIDESTRVVWRYVVDMIVGSRIEEIEDDEEQSGLLRTLDRLYEDLVEDPRVFMSDEEWAIEHAIETLRRIR